MDDDDKKCHENVDVILARSGAIIENPSFKIRRFVRDNLTVAPLPTAIVPRPCRFAVYTENPQTNTFWMPLHWTLSRFPNARVEDRRGKGSAHEHPFDGRPRESQKPALEKTIETLETYGGAVMCLPTGGGKTACALYLSTYFKSKTLILVHKKILLDQWTQRIKQFVPSAGVSVIQGTTCDTSGDYVVAMIQTVISRDFTDGTFDSFRLLVVDECHHVAAPAFMKCMHRLNCPLTLGLSATPERKDGLQKLLHWHLGPMSHRETMEHRSDVKARQLTYACRHFKATPPPTNVKGTIDSNAVIKALVDNEERTDLIANVVRALPHHRRVLVLSHRREHCRIIVEKLQRLGATDAGLRLGGSSKLTKLLGDDGDDPRILVATYALVSEGFDDPRLDTLVLATPASDVTQAVGRILRRRPREARNDAGAVDEEDGDRPLILDFVDAWGPCFAQAKKRRATYQKAGFEFFS